MKQLSEVVAVGGTHLGVGALAIAALFALPAAAHHSYAMYDTTRRVTAQGVIVKFEWTNPHTFIWFYTPKEGGGYQLVGLESGGPAELARKGWTKDTFKVGDKVTIEYIPLKDGRPGGNFSKAIHADGSVSIADGPPPGAAAPGGSAPRGASERQP